MSDTNVLERFLKDAAEGIEKKRKAKAPPLNGQYRNELWYRHIYKTLDVDEAYAVTKANIKRKSFAHEPEIAKAVYEEVYGRKFQSPEERLVDAQRSEVERLKAEIEALKAAKVAVSTNVEKDVETETSTAFDPPAGLTKDEFRPMFYEWFEKSQGRKPNGGQLTAAWGTYCKKNEIKGQ